MLCFYPFLKFPIVFWITQSMTQPSLFPTWAVFRLRKKWNYAKRNTWLNHDFTIYDFSYLTTQKKLQRKPKQLSTPWNFWNVLFEDFVRVNYFLYIIEITVSYIQKWFLQDQFDENLSISKAMTVPN